MDNGGAVFAGFHHPAKTDGMRFGHAGPLNQNAIGILQILLSGGRAAAAEGGAQTGHRAAVSYPGLIGNGDHTQAAGKQLSDEIVLLIIKSCSTEMSDGCRMVYV